MAKSKSQQKAAAPVPSASDKVKATKSIDASKVAAKDLKIKSEKPAKKVKAPSPVPESSSESEDDSDSEDESDSGDESDTEDAPAKSNGVAPVKNGVAAESDSDSDSDSESESEDEEAAEAKAMVTKSVATKVGSSKEDESEDDDSSDEEETTSGATPAAAVNGSKVAESSDESDGSSDSDEEEEEKPAPVAAKKRKADADEVPAAKKTKTASGPVSKNPPSKNLFVGNLSWNVDEAWLASHFGTFGEVVGARIITDRETGKGKGFGYVEFAELEPAVEAFQQTNGTELDGRTMNVDYSTPRTNNAGPNGRAERVDTRAKRHGDGQSVPSDTIFVGNISFDATAEIIQEKFAEYGNVTRVALPTDMETQALKGYGYVGFTSIDEAKAALEALNGADIAGRAVRLDFATARQDRDGGSSRGRGGSRGGSRGRGGFGGGRGDRGGRGNFGGRGNSRGGRGGSTNRGGLGDFSGKKISF